MRSLYFRQCVFLPLALFLAACSSKTKDEPSVKSPLTLQKGSPSTPSNDGQSLTVNGDSDSGKAGPLRSVYFDLGSYELTTPAQQSLQVASEFLTGNPSVRIMIEGHCDEKGTEVFNQRLGMQRAESIQSFLVSQGVNAGQLEVKSFGELRPIAFGQNEESWMRNRRANFVILSQ